MSALNILCVICSEFYDANDEVLSTECGHLFHKTCLNRWLQTSRTCPECRQSYNQLRSHRVYLNFSQPTDLDLENLRIRKSREPEWRTFTSSEVDGVKVYDPAHKPLESGVDFAGNKVYVARCPFKEDLVPANYVPHKNAVYLPWGVAGHKLPLDNAEYLVDDGYYDWVAATNGGVPPNALPVGYANPNTQYKNVLYTGRAQYRGITYPGKVHPSHRNLYMPCEGREISKNEYEVLVRISPGDNTVSICRHLEYEEEEVSDREYRYDSDVYSNDDD